MKPYTIVVHFSDPNPMGYPFNYLHLFDAYVHLAAYFKTQGLTLYVARGDSYLGSMTFQGGWRFEEGALVPVSEPIHSDLIYMKGQGGVLQTAATDLVVNSPEFDQICRDKMVTCELFPEFSAPAYRINSENWQEVIEKITTDRVVLKPTVGEGGHGVIITEKAGFTFSDHPIEGEYMAQEFIDASGGIPGLVEGVHELRILRFTEDTLLAYLRIPQKGNLLANIAQGGYARHVKKEDIPKRALEIFYEADKRLTKYSPRIYTMDFIFQGTTPFIGEMNSRPGLPQPKIEGPELATLFNSLLAQAFRQAIEQRTS